MPGIAGFVFIPVITLLLTLSFLSLPSQFLPGLIISFGVLLCLTIWAGYTKKEQGVPFLKASLAMRFLFAILICEIMVYFYPGRDAVGYNIDGFQAMLMLKEGDLSTFINTSFLGGGGTTFYKKMTGVMFLFLGPNEITVRVFNTIVAWAGSLFFFRAFSEGMEQKQKKLLAILLFFTPSLLLWSSIHGKDPWMFFGITAFSWASMGVLKRGFPNLLELLVGGLSILIIYFIRPHIDMLLAGSLLVAAIFSRSGTPKIRRFIPFIASVLLLYFAYTTFLSWVGVEESGSIKALTETGFEHQERIIESGGSLYEIPAALKPLVLVVAPLIVYVRPFPFEARNIFALYTSVESLIILIILLIGFWKLFKFSRDQITDPRVVFSFTYLIAFAMLFVFSGNFGIIARQRAAQAMPFMFFLASFAANRTKP